jgi:hypothetical protein
MKEWMQGSVSWEAMQGGSAILPMLMFLPSRPIKTVNASRRPASEPRKVVFSTARDFKMRAALARHEPVRKSEVEL